MNNGQHVARSRHLEELARAAKQYTLQEILDVTEAVANELNDFTGATSITGGLSGLVPAPQSGDELKFLRGDGSWATVESGGASVAVFTGAAANDGTSGLVPAPHAGDNAKFLRGDGTWASVESGSAGSGAIDYVIGSNVSTVEGGFWQDIYNDVPILKLRHGDYEYNFQYDGLTRVSDIDSSIATVTPNTYVLGTASVSNDGGVWYEVNSNNVPTLNLHKSNFNYSFNYDSITYKGNNANLVAYLPFDTSLADACGNEWVTQGSPTIDNYYHGLNTSPNYTCIYNDTIANSIGSNSWAVDFYGKVTADLGGDAAVSFFGTTAKDEQNAYTDYFVFWFIKNVGGRSFAIQTNGQLYYSPKVADGSQKQHYAVTYDGTTIRVFLNGVLAISTEADITLSGTFTIGGANPDNCGADAVFDHFRIWRTAIWTENFTPPTESDYL